MIAKQIAPAAAHAAAMGVDQLAQRNAHRLFDRAGPLDVAGNAEQLRAGVVRPADAGEPRGAAPHDVGHDRDALDVVDRGRAAVEAHVGRERRLQPRLALLAFEALQQRHLLAADVGAGAVMDVEVEVVAVDVVLADELGLIGLVDRGLQVLALADEFAAHVDVARAAIHRAAGDQAALDQEMRIVPHDLAVLAGAGLGLVGVDHEIMRPVADRLRHERPFHAGREAGAAAAAQARGLDLVDDDRRGPCPGSPWCRPRSRACARLRGPSRPGRRGF